MIAFGFGVLATIIFLLLLFFLGQWVPDLAQWIRGVLP